MTHGCFSIGDGDSPPTLTSNLSERHEHKLPALIRETTLQANT